MQIIKSREDVLFVKVDFDGNKAMCRTLGVKVLPFFHFYRGSSGRVAEFSASLSKIDRLRSALEQHGAARCPLGDSTPALVRAVASCARPGCNPRVPQRASHAYARGARSRRSW